MWEITNNRRVIFGEDSVKQLPDILKWQGVKKVFFVTFSASAAPTSNIKELLQDAGISYVIYDKVVAEPDSVVIDGGRDLFLQEGCDCTVALGGGSVIDTAKSINMLSTNGGSVEEYQMGEKQVTKESPFYVAIPTTSGTGAEGTKTAVVKNVHNGLKKSLYHVSMIADVVILDPKMTLTLPKAITAATGMDALSHAIESYVSKNATPITEMYGLKAISLISQSLEKACNDPLDIEARGNMALASYFGGMAITAGIGIAHICAQPIGGEFHVPHGDACAIFLPASMEFNLDFAEKKYADIARALGVYDRNATQRENAENAIKEVKRIRSAVGAPDSLRKYLPAELPSEDYVADVIFRTCGHITCNPAPVDKEVYKKFYREAL